MEQTLEGLRRPHRYVLDDAQLHIYMLMKKVGTPSLCRPGGSGASSPAQASVPPTPRAGSKGHCPGALSIHSRPQGAALTLPFIAEQTEPPRGCPRHALNEGPALTLRSILIGNNSDIHKNKVK